MFRVDFRFENSGLWATSGAPASAQIAWGIAKSLRNSQQQVEVRVVPTQPQTRLVDLKI